MWLEGSLMLGNRAVSESACVFQSLPTHGKRLFRGIRISDIHVYHSTSLSLSLFDEQLPMLIKKNFFRSLLIEPSEALLQKLLSQPNNPLFQMQSNTNMIFVKSVQL